MVDLNTLRSNRAKPLPIDPHEILRRLPKPAGFNDLYSSQAEVLKQWFDSRSAKDTVVKLHTGGGKTLVGLLMAQSTLNELKLPVLYLAPTTQLVEQTLERAAQFGIPAVPYEAGAGPLNDAFANAKAIMVATYKSLFHGRSKFGLEGTANPLMAGAIILDDAHSSFPLVRESFTLNVSAYSDKERYKEMCDLFRQAFRDIGKAGTFDDIVSGREGAVIEVPYGAWRELIQAVEQLLRKDLAPFKYQWPLVRDRLLMCHAFVSSANFSITPILPFPNAFPTFAHCPRRVYMSATIADDSDLLRTFGADFELAKKPLRSRSLAGISERLILCPDIMPFAMNTRTAVEELAGRLSSSKKGVVFLTPSGKIAEEWKTIGTVAENSDDVQKIVSALQSGTRFGPYVLANRYDGIDLPGDACRLLVLSGLPTGTSEYEKYRATAVYGGASFNRMLAQRIEQGIGRGARGAGDHCVVLIVGTDLASWVSKEANFGFLTSATQAQLTIGTEISKAVKTRDEFFATAMRCIDREPVWQSYHAEMLDELVEEPESDQDHLELAAIERKAIDLWASGNHEKAIARLEKAAGLASIDSQEKGWVLQLAARIADDWGNDERTEDLQRNAYAHNPNLKRPKKMETHRLLPAPGAQAKAIVVSIQAYRFRKGYLSEFDHLVANLTAEASANQFEQALANLGRMLGFSASRHDDAGVGPDVLWLLPNKQGLIIEAKSRKREDNPLNKQEHGQLLVAEQWFAQQYDGFTSVRVSIVPNTKSTEAASAEQSCALTLDKLQVMVSDARALIANLCESQLSAVQLEGHCAQLLEKSPLAAHNIVKSYLQSFKTA
jgi:tetratricopeptide (TPR) repeat protein